MADLAFVNQHNMVTYLEKSDENAEFHQIVDFLSTCSINYAITVSPTIYASYIKQFWNTATSKTVNSAKQIHAIVDGKVVVISKSSVRNDLLFDDEDGITCLTNDDIFKNLALMGTLEQTRLSIRRGSDSVERAITTDASLVAAHDSDNIIRTLTTAMPNVYNPLGMDTSGSPRRQETIGGAPAQTRSERVLKQPNEPPLSECHTSGSGEGLNFWLQVLVFLILRAWIKGSGLYIMDPYNGVQELPSDDNGLILELAQVERRQKERAAQEEASMAALYEEYDTIQASIDVDALFAARLQQEEREQAAEIRSKPPTKTQLKNMMIPYLKNIGKFNHNQLKAKSYEELQRLYEMEQKWIHDFVPMDSEKEEKKLVDPESEGKKGKRIKRVANLELKQKSSKKPKVIKEQESIESHEEAAADYKQEKYSQS
ncbi:hypothetical protein Tco_1056166 [Tanacetum coccineum]|uniref:Xylulose kinase-1 n=1 Tax=Tanacetum coccineum TaxID=301880 RepID=A0ABQ5H2Y6_9ASTR